MPFPKYGLFGFIEWFIIGYEEARLGYLELLRNPNLTAHVPAYLELIHGLPHWDYKSACHWPPNSWHISGCQDFATDLNVNGAAKEYRDTLPYVLTVPVEYCDWCRRPATTCYMDAIQDAMFCCPEHAIAHRRRTLELMPHVAALYSNFAFQPLHFNHLKLKRYLSSLPDIYDGTLVSHAPINLPVVTNDSKISKVSTGNLPVGLIIEEE